MHPESADAKLPAMTVSPCLLLGRRTLERAGFAPGDYLTDGERLLRVVARFDPRAEHPSAVLEDCLTLEIDAYTPDALVAMPLHPVSRRDEAHRQGSTTSSR
jgi:hypothetical protein